MSFADFLIHTCNIQTLSFSASGYEKTKVWNTAYSDVACRHDSDNGAKINDTEIRVNMDDDLFFFDADTTINRGDRIVEDGLNYDVIKVNKLYGATSLHHLEVRARLVDNQ